MGGGGGRERREERERLDTAVALAFVGEGVRAPGAPVHGVMRVLQEVWGCFVGEEVGHIAPHKGILAAASVPGKRTRS